MVSDGQHSSFPLCPDPLHLQHLPWRDSVARSSPCSLRGCFSGLCHVPTHACGLVLVGLNLALTLQLSADLPSPGAAVEPPVAARVAVVGNVVELPLARGRMVSLGAYVRKVFCVGFESLGKLLLISFFWSSIDRAASNRSLILVCFRASNECEIDGFRVSLNLSTFSSSGVPACCQSLNS